MKASSYNKIIKLEDNRRIAFNSVSCVLAEVEDNFFDILDNINTLSVETLNEEEKELLENMRENNFIIEENIDELKIVKYKHHTGKYSNNVLGLTIAPTLECNFACPYCYETPQKGLMSDAVQNAIIDFVDKFVVENKSVHICWYGGEPIIAKDIIKNLSMRIIEICKTRNAEYEASIVTNGYLLSETLIDEFSQLKIADYQITIDGPPSIHNKRRKLKYSEADTFYKIVENVKILQNKDIAFNIRVNIDKENTAHLSELMDALESNGLSGANVYFGHVKDYNAICGSIGGTCYNNEEFSRFSYNYQKELRKRGFQKKISYPTTKSNYCCADSVSSYVLDHQGYVYKCWNDVGTHTLSIGNICTFDNVPEVNYMNNVDYILWSPFEFEKCTKCWLLPICMGGCPFNGMKENDPECEKWKYIIEESILDNYLDRISEDIMND